MNTILLFCIILSAILIATFQDLKRREVDNWLNFLLLFSGISFIIFNFIFSKNPTYLYQGIFAIILGLIFANLFYYGRVFAGGDAKLLLAISPYFTGLSFLETTTNIIIFIFCLFVAGSIYGLIYSLTLYIKNIKTTNKKIKQNIKKVKFWIFLIIGVTLLIFYQINQIFLILGLLIIIFPFLFAFAKGLEEAVSIKYIKATELREGDWLAEDIKIGKKTIPASFEGITKQEIKLLKHKNKIKIKEGIPFVPSFLFGLLLYYFYSYIFINLIYNFLNNLI